jgi:hypothetical protein
LDTLAKLSFGPELEARVYRPQFLPKRASGRESHTEREENGMPAKTNILRLAIILTFIAGGISVAAGFLLNNTLPGELAQFVKAQEATEVTNRQAATSIPYLLIIAALVTGLIGLWWCKRWARLLFSIAAILVPPMTAILGFVSSETLVSNAVEAGAASALSMFIGVVIALAWFGMPE